MPGTVMMDMDFLDSTNPMGSINLHEMIERDMRTQTFDECLSTEAALLISTHAKDADIDAYNTTQIEDHLESFGSEMLRDSQNLPWFNISGTSHNSNLDSDPAGILVNPQTGLPITYQLDTSIDLDLMPEEKDSENEEQAIKPFNSVNPTMLEHHDANLLKERLAKINGGIKHKVLKERNGHKNGSNKLPVQGPLRKGFMEDSSSSSSSSSSSESSSSDEEIDEYPNIEDDDDEDFDTEERYFNPTASHSNKTMKSKCAGGQMPKHEEHTLVLHGNNGERALAGRSFPKPAYSYSCLIAMALKNSNTGSLPVSEIYGFMTENYPYFRTAPNGWKNSVRHNLSLNKCFEKIEKPGTGNQRKGCLWTMNPGKIGKMDEEVAKWQRKDPLAIKQSMAKPEHFDLLEKGYLKLQVPSREDTNGTTENGGDNVTKHFPKIKTEEIQDSNDSDIDNSLLDLNFQSGLWGELDDKMDFDIPLAADSFPNVHVGFAFEDNLGSNTTAGSNGHATDVANAFNGTFLSKQLRITKTFSLK